MISLYQQHVDKWKDCTACNLSLCRVDRPDKYRTVFARGTIPCDVLFIGEAPGVSENVLGRPFVGPAGHLMDRILLKAFRGIDKVLTYALTNLVCCIPVDETGGKAGTPQDVEIQACSERLIEFYEICRPSLIICVGELAEAWVKYILPDLVPTIHVAHPAYIIRKPYAQQGLMEQRVVVQIRTALEDL